MNMKIRYLIFGCIVILICILLSIYKIKNDYNDIEYIKKNIETSINYAYDNNIISKDNTNEISDIIDSKILMGLNPRYWSDEAENNFYNGVTENFQITDIKFIKYNVFKSEFIFRVDYIYQQYDKIRTCSHRRFKSK